jgi:hypothetical protein
MDDEGMDAKPAKWDEWEQEKQQQWMREHAAVRVRRQMQEEDIKKSQAKSDRRRIRARNTGITSGLAAGAGVLVLSIALAVWLRWRAGARAKRALAARIDELVAEFPQEVSCLGGPSALRDRAIVRQLLRDLEAQR